MQTVPDDLRKRLRAFNQEHVLAWGDRLNAVERTELVAQLQAIDLELLKKLYAERDKPPVVVRPDEMEPIEVTPSPSPDDAAAKVQGEESLRRGEVATLVVAGGQGSRLGFEYPKGMYPVGPVTHKSLFQFHAEKVLATRKRYGAAVPFLVMTSPATHTETVDYFEKNRYFGLPADGVAFFQQGTMPALDLSTGRLLLEAPGRLFLGPDGHGGSLTALAASGLLGKLRQNGVRHLFYFQVDNPLVKIADPVFLGHHIAKQAQVSSKVIRKETPTEKLGNFVQVNNRCTMIEYSDLPEDLAKKTRTDGRLLIDAGNPAIHVFDLAFLASVTSGAATIPFHIAKKKVPHIDKAGQAVQPTKENALKFERFIFDVLPRASRWALVETTRREEFAPLKNADGPDSPASVARAITELAADWLTTAGVKVPRDADGTPTFPLEISPLFALDSAELARKVSGTTQIDGPRYWE